MSVEENHRLKIWELNNDGTNAHRLSKQWPEDSHQGSGRWTPDGRHFIFQSNAGGVNNIYELIEPGWLAFWKKPTAVKLTAGDIEVVDAAPSRDSRQLFVMGRLAQGAMQVFDPQQKRFVPFLGGLAASELVISPDKQWMAYTDFPRHFLWRSRLDGSEKLQLTSSYAAWPRWAPDGKTIAYMDWRSIYTISCEGGTPEKLTGGGEASAVAPEWTPDGKAITFNDFPRLGHADRRGAKKYNQNLSARRADRAKQFLVDQGIAADKIEVRAHGYQQNMAADKVKELIGRHPDLTDMERETYLKKLSSVVLATNRRVDLSLSTGQESIRHYTFKADDSSALLRREIPTLRGETAAKLEPSFCFSAAR